MSKTQQKPWPPERLIRLREFLGISQLELGRQLGLQARTSPAHWEQGRRPTSPKYWRALEALEKLMTDTVEPRFVSFTGRCLSSDWEVISAFLKTHPSLFDIVGLGLVEPEEAEEAPVVPLKPVCIGALYPRAKRYDFDPEAFPGNWDKLGGRGALRRRGKRGNLLKPMSTQTNEAHDNAFVHVSLWDSDDPDATRAGEGDVDLAMISAYFFTEWPLEGSFTRSWRSHTVVPLDEDPRNVHPSNLRWVRRLGLLPLQTEDDEPTPRTNIEELAASARQRRRDEEDSNE